MGVTPLLDMLAALVAWVALASCVPPAVDPATLPLPTLDPDREIRDVTTGGLHALREVAGAAGIAIETGRDGKMLHAICGAHARGVDLRLPAERPRCYRCVLAPIDAGPQDPYAPHPLDAALHRLAAQLARYPRAFLRAARIDALSLCTLLEDDTTGEPAPIAGLASPNDRRMLLRLADADLGSLGDALHHEIYHLFDSTTPHYTDDPAWAALNPPGFRYGPRARGERGFVDDYARTAITEDRASTYHHLMIDRAAVCARAGRDPILRQKLALVAARVAPSLGADPGCR